MSYLPLKFRASFPSLQGVFLFNGKPIKIKGMQNTDATVDKYNVSESFVSTRRESTRAFSRHGTCH